MDTDDILAHRNSCNATYGDIKENDLVWVQGWCFVASDITNIDGVVRFTGKCPALAGTGYDGARYGARQDVKCNIVHWHSFE